MKYQTGFHTQMIMDQGISGLRLSLQQPMAASSPGINFDTEMFVCARQSGPSRREYGAYVDESFLSTHPTCLGTGPESELHT
jgi:hypothetical protein